MEFKNKKNVKILYEIIEDTDIFKSLDNKCQNEIYNIFYSNLDKFYEIEEKKNTSLLQLNQKYISLIINYIKKNYITNLQQPVKIKIYDEYIPHQQIEKELITYEDIQNNNKKQFENEFNKKQEEFKEMINVKIPQVPDFIDKFQDKPIKHIDKIIKDIQNQRKYDVEQINKNNTQNTIDFLTSLETKKKDNKVSFDKTIITIYPNEQNHEDIDKNTYSNLENINENNIINNDDYIFSKLKKKDNINFNDNIDKIEKEKFDRIEKIEKDIITLNYKLDKILEIIQKTK